MFKSLPVKMASNTITALPYLVMTKFLNSKFNVTTQNNEMLEELVTLFWVDGLSVGERTVTVYYCYK